MQRLAEISAAAAAQAKSTLQQVRELAIGAGGNTSYAGHDKLCRKGCKITWPRWQDV